MGSHLGRLCVMWVIASSSCRQPAAPAPSPSLQVAPSIPEALPASWGVEVPDELMVTGGRIEAVNTDGQSLWYIEPSIVTAYDARTDEHARDAREYRHLIDQWSQTIAPSGEWRLQTTLMAEDAQWNIVIEGQPDQPRIDVSATITYASPRFVGREALVLDFPTAETGRVLDRAYREVALTGARSIAGPWTPQWVWLSTDTTQLSLVGEAQSLVVESRPERGFRVSLEADHWESHPLRPYDDCWSHYEFAHDEARRILGPQHRGPEDSHTVRATVWLGAFTGVRPMRYPQSFNAALSITDHADQSDVAKLGALLYGEWHYGDIPSEVDKRDRGFAGRDLGMTKTLFNDLSGSGRGYAQQLANPEFAALVTHTRQASPHIEFGPHSATGHKDTTAETDRALDAFEDLNARVWIDHQPSTNCEALANRGTHQDSPYYVVRTLKDHGIRYAWATWDQSPDDDANLFLPARASERRPVLFRHSAVGGHDTDAPMWLFPSLWRSVSFDRFLAMYAEESLNQLEADHGFHIAHTYLDLYLPPDERRADRTLLGPIQDAPTGKTTGYRITPEADALFARWQERQQRGSLWVRGVATVSDHLIAMRSVQLHYEPRAVRIKNPTVHPILGASFLVPGPERWPHINGEQLPSEQVEHTSDGLRFWIDMPPTSDIEVTLRLSTEPEPVALLQHPGFLTLTRP